MAKYSTKKSINFGTNLSFLMKENKIDYDKVVDSIGFKRTTWSGYVNEKSFPKVEDFLKIAEYFDISLDDLMYSDLSNGGDYKKTTVHTLYKKGGDLGGDLGRDAQKKGNNWNLNDSQSNYNTNYNNLVKEIELKDSVIEALRGQIEALKDSNATLNSLIREMGKDDDTSQKRSAAG